MKVRKGIKRLAALILCFVLSLPMFFPNIELAYASNDSQVSTEQQMENTEEKSLADVGEAEKSESSNPKDIDTQSPLQPQEQQDVPNTEKGMETESETQTETKAESSVNEKEEAKKKETEIKETEADGIDNKEKTGNGTEKNVKIASENFTVENIKQAIALKEGIYANKEDVPEGTEATPETYVDSNFAQAIYDSIAAQPDAFLNGTLESNTFADINALLNSFKGNLNAVGKGIRSIKGISMLKSCAQWNLSNNQITDLCPLSVTDAIDEDTAYEQGTYYGGNGWNIVINIEGNPITSYPNWIGGKVDFDPILSKGRVTLDNHKYIIVYDDSDGFSKSYDIPLDLWIGTDRVDIRKTTLRVVENKPYTTGATIVSNGGRMESVKITGIKSSGEAELRLGGSTASFMNWFYSFEGDEDIQSNGSTLSWTIPIEILCYVSANKGNVDTTHAVRLEKKGVDDYEPKEGARYNLYKQLGDTPDQNTDEQIGETYVTNADGVIKVPGLETGKFYFVEIEGSEGYGTIADPVKFTLSDGSMNITGGAGSEITADDGIHKKPDGTFMLGGVTETDKYTPVTLDITEPSSGKLKSIEVSWSEGNMGGTESNMKYIVGSAPDVIPQNETYVTNLEEAKRKAEAQIDACRLLNQNVTVSASFDQLVSTAVQYDPLKPVKVIVNAEKKLVYPNDKDAGVPEDGKFTFHLTNADGEPADRKAIDITAANVGKQVTFQFEIGDDINKDTPKDGDTYLYRYILTEVSDVDNDDEYQYDKSTWEVTVPVVKETAGLRVKENEITYKKKGSTDSDATVAKFTNIKRKIPLAFSKVSEDGTTPLKGAGFTLYVCNNTEAGHIHGENCTWDKEQKYKPEITSGEDGKIEFDEVPINAQYILVESTTPEGCSVPSERSFILVSIADIDGHGEVTMKGYGDFSNTNMNMEMVEKNGDTGVFHVKNIHYYDLSISKTVKGDVANLLKEFHFTITLKDPKGDLVNGTYSYKGAATAEAAAPADGTLTFVNGEASITLKHGQSIRIKDILAYSEYKVEEQEANTDGYKTTSENSSEKITGDITASFVNVKYSNPITGLFDLYGTGMSAIFITILGIGTAAFLLHRRRKHS